MEEIRGGLGRRRERSRRAQAAVETNCVNMNMNEQVMGG